MKDLYIEKVAGEIISLDWCRVELLCGERVQSCATIELENIAYTMDICREWAKKEKARLIAGLQPPPLAWDGKSWSFRVL
jgi:hypothetical protein